MDGGSLKKSFVRVELNGDVDVPETPSRALEVMQFSALAYLSRNEVWGEVERRRPGVREGKGRAWETARTTLANCVQEGDFNLASTASKNCTTSTPEVLFSDHSAACVRRVFYKTDPTGSNR